MTNNIDVNAKVSNLAVSNSPSRLQCLVLSSVDIEHAFGHAINTLQLAWRYYDRGAAFDTRYQKRDVIF